LVELFETHVDLKDFQEFEGAFERDVVMEFLILD